ncbi:MAG: HlyC/CorC family transporter [Solirubrobacterales bacterium]|nr:HlyC/CorC family transporter [Solirubrobacterales bacterium]MCB8971455.1 HlyC/CorC family transporter [Thermoleophilales bacterium]MCO5327133.1 hemolysin family protein [Solirubrobacterales bacterium]
MTEVLLLVIVFILVLVNGYFVAAEFAIVRARPSKLQQLSQEGDPRAKRALHQIGHVDEYVATSQVGITLASLAIGFLGEPAIARLLEPVLGGWVGHAASIVIALIIAYAIVTLLHVILGEQAPKMVGIARGEQLLLRIGRSLEFFRGAFKPLILLTNKPARWIVQSVFRIPIVSEDETSPEELRVLISRGYEQGDLEESEAGMLGGVFHLHEQEAREVMTPIPAVVTVDSSDTVEDALRRCVASGHTRLVVIEDDNPDRVRGVVHNNSLARLYMNAGADASIEPAVRDAPIIPETKPLDDLLAELQRQRSSIAIVVDEYGRTVGIATVEDILEEVVGEIEDETDPRGEHVRRLTDGDWYVRGHVSLGDVEDAGVKLPVDTDAYNSIGGYVFSELGRLPKRGDTIHAGGHTIRVESVRENRIVALRIHPDGPATQEHKAVEARAQGDDSQG